MNHSMLTCGRTTHLKIVAVALIAAVLFTTVGLKARLDDSGAGNVTATEKAGSPATKAGKHALYSTRDDAAVRRHDSSRRFVSGTERDRQPSTYVTPRPHSRGRSSAGPPGLTASIFSMRLPRAVRAFRAAAISASESSSSEVNEGGRSENHANLSRD
jgi:hypothetical protein